MQNINPELFIQGMYFNPFSISQALNWQILEIEVL